MSASFVDVHHADVGYTPRRSFWLPTVDPDKEHVILRDVSFSLPQAAQVTVFGHAGAGKTTLLRLLSGRTQPLRGLVTINGSSPGKLPQLASGYVAPEALLMEEKTGQDLLLAYRTTARFRDAGTIAEQLHLEKILRRPVYTLSSVERMRVALAQAYLADSPLILLDGVADEIGTEATKHLLTHVLKARTVMITTRSVATADALGLPIMLLHRGHLSHFGTSEEIANAVASPRVLKIWVEGLRYSLLRKLKEHPGVAEVRLVASSRFAGQCLRINTHSSHFLPSLYDLVSQAPLVRVEAQAVSLNDILHRLESR